MIVFFSNTVTSRYECSREVSLLCLAGAPADLGNHDVHAERGVLVHEVRLELVDGVGHLPRRVGAAADDAETAGVGDGCGQAGARRPIHACQHDGMLDSQQLRGGSLDRWGLSRKILAVGIMEVWDRNLRSSAMAIR